MKIKTRTITLTNRAPVRICEGEWPIIASAVTTDGPADKAQWDQAEARGELASWSIRVRLHTDGRCIVYGVTEPPECASVNRSPVEHWRGGRLLSRGSSVGRVIDAINQIATAGCMPARVARECIANLPAVTI